MKLRSFSTALFIVLALLSCCLILWHKPDNLSRLHWKVMHHSIHSDPVPQHHSQTINTRSLRFSHAVSLAAVDANRVVAVWYGGSDEGRSDVALYMSRYKRGGPGWSPAVKILDRKTLMQQEHRFVHTIGNPVILVDGHRWIVFFSSAFSGWSTASLNTMVSNDQGKHWSSARELVTSAFFNISHNLKGTPLLYQKGIVALPAYRELFNTDGIAYVLSPDLTIQHASLMSDNHYSLQPVIVPLSSEHAIAYLRHAHERAHPANHLMVTQSFDAGLRWGKALPVAGVFNPDSAIAAIDTLQGLLLCLNPDAMKRHHLILLYHHDRYTLASSLKGSFSYPYLIHWGPNQYLVGYSVPHGLRTFSFNQAWLREQMR